MCEVICIACKEDIEEDEGTYCEGCHELEADEKAVAIAEEIAANADDPYEEPKDRMRDLLARVVATNPTDTEGWKWLRADIEDGLRRDFREPPGPWVQDTTAPNKVSMARPTTLVGLRSLWGLDA